MRRAALLAALLAACVLQAAPDDLAVARRALGDGLWQVAVRHARAAAGGTTDAGTLRTARLVELEALAGAAQPADILARLEDWKDVADDAFRYWRAWALERQNKLAEARDLLKAPFGQPAYAALALRLSARIETAAGDAATASRRFAEASAALASNAVQRVENATEWARALRTFGKPAEALAVLQKERAAEASGTVGDAARLLSAELLSETGASAQARPILEKLVAGSTNTEERTYVLAACALSERLHAEGATNLALRVASNAVARAVQPDLACRAGYALGFELLADPSTRTSAVALVTSLVRRHPDDPQSGAAQRRLADGLLAAGDATGALREYDVLLQSYPSHALDAHVLEGRGWAFLRLGRRAEAVGQFARAVQVTTNEEVKARCAFKQAESLVADGRLEEAAAVYGAVTHARFREQALFRRADALSRAKQTAAAIEIFSALFREGGETSVEAGIRVAAGELALGRLDRAGAAYDAVLDEKAPRRPTPEQRGAALAGRGRARYRDYRFADAARDFAEVARLLPARRDEMGFLSVLCLYGDGKDEAARAAGRKLLETVSEGPLKGDLLMWLAKYDAGRREWTAAIRGFEACAADAHVGDAQRIEALVRGIRCASAMRDYPKAVELAGRVATNEVAVAAMKTARPESAHVAEALLVQGEALVELGRFKDAVQVLERAGRVPAPQALLRRAGLVRADCLFAMGADDSSRYLAAFEAYRTLLQDEDLPGSLRIAAAFKAGRALEKLDRQEDAVDQFYTNVVMDYWNAVNPASPDTSRRHWFDGNARAVFARTAFILSDYYIARRQPQQAEKMLSYIVSAKVPGADEAKRRIARLREKGGLE